MKNKSKKNNKNIKFGGWFSLNAQERDNVKFTTLFFDKCRINKKKPGGGIVDAKKYRASCRVQILAWAPNLKGEC